MTDQQYPQWQQHLREAQAAIRLQNERDEREADERRQTDAASREAVLAGELARALTLLGLPHIGAAPASNQVTLEGGYVVSILGKLDEADWKDGTHHIRFQLKIRKLAYPANDNLELAECWASRQQSFDLVGEAIPADFARFANALDDVDSDVEEKRGTLEILRERAARSKQQALRDSAYEAAMAAQPAEPTTAEQLLDLIRQIVREERYEY